MERWPGTVTVVKITLLLRAHYPECVRIGRRWGVPVTELAITRGFALSLLKMDTFTEPRSLGTGTPTEPQP